MASQGPPLGNQPLTDSYLRVKMNIDSQQQRIDQMQEKMSAMQGTIDRHEKLLAQFQKYLTVSQLNP